MSVAENMYEYDDEVRDLNYSRVLDVHVWSDYWLEKTPEPAACQKATEKLYKRNLGGSLVWVIK